MSREDFFTSQAQDKKLLAFLNFHIILLEAEFVILKKLVLTAASLAQINRLKPGFWERNRTAFFTSEVAALN